ncbi:MAG: DUF1330 domain-containing protein [Gemmatimonadota bacterium]|nr:MAG: DUF1330 domain-containing protein [Gemmatimonadota bacterium]
MRAYVLVDIDVKDPEGFGRYVRDVSPVLERWGARYLVRGGDVEVLEGSWDHHRVVLLEFPSRAVAQAFYASEEYMPLLKLRLESTESTLAIMEGWEPG